MYINSTKGSPCWVSIATVVTRTRLNITLYKHFLSCFLLYLHCAHQRQLTRKRKSDNYSWKVVRGGKGKVTFVAIFRAAHLAVTWSRSLSVHVTLNTLLPPRLVMYLHKTINCNFCTSWGAVGSPVICMLPAWGPTVGVEAGGCNQIWEEQRVVNYTT